VLKKPWNKNQMVNDVTCGKRLTNKTPSKQQPGAILRPLILLIKTNWQRSIYGSREDAFIGQRKTAQLCGLRKISAQFYSGQEVN
jgi:hypothetical protein